MPDMERRPAFLDEAAADRVRTAALLIGRGGRARGANEALFRVAAHLQRSWPRRVLEAAFLEIGDPSIPGGIDLCVERGAERIIVIPCFLFRGDRVKTDLLAFLREGREKYADIDVILGPHLGFHPKLIEIVDERIRQALETLEFEEKAAP